MVRDLAKSVVLCILTDTSLKYVSLVDFILVVPFNPNPRNKKMTFLDVLNS